MKLKLINGIKTFVAIVEVSFVCSLYFAALSDAGYKLWVYGNLKFSNPDIVVECLILYFTVFTLFGLVIVLLYSVNRELWDLVDEKREEFKLLKMIPNIKLLASFYLDFRDYLFHAEE